MSVLLRVIAGLVMALGILALVAIFYGAAAREQRVRVIEIGWLLDTGVADRAGRLDSRWGSLGGHADSLSKFDLFRHCHAAFATRGPKTVGNGFRTPDHRTYADRPRNHAFVIGCILIYRPRIPPSSVPIFWELLAIAVISWCYSCLGGILLALTRIAYPPTEPPDREDAPRGPAST